MGREEIVFFSFLLTLLLQSHFEDGGLGSFHLDICFDASSISDHTPGFGEKLLCEWVGGWVGGWLDRLGRERRKRRFE